MGTLRKAANGAADFAIVMDRRVATTDTRVLNILRKHASPSTYDMITLTCDEYIRGSKAKPKSADLKAGLEQLKEWVDINGYNCIGVMGAETFEKVMGFKGISKFINRPIWSDVLNCKVVPIVHPNQLLYQDPVLTESYKVGFEVLLEQAQYPELRQQEAEPVSYQYINTIGKFRKFLEYYCSEAVHTFAYDLETSGFRFNVDRILTIQFSHKTHVSYLIPTDFYEGVWTKDEWEEVITGLRKLFADDSKLVLGHNIKFDNRFIEHHWGIPVRKHNVFDTMIASFLCDETTPNGLKELSCQYTDLGAYDDELEAFKKKYCKENKIKEGDFSYAFIPFDILALYALKDTDCTFRLYEIFKEKLKEEQQEQVFAMVMQFQYLLSRMEITGSPVDVAYAKEYLIDVDKQLAVMKQSLLATDFVTAAEDLINTRGAEKHEKEGKSGKYKFKPFNLNSTDQKRVLFYDVMKLPIFYVSKVKTKIPDLTTKRIENIVKNFAKEAGIKLGTIKDEKGMPKVPTADVKFWLRKKASVDKRSIKEWDSLQKWGCQNCFLTLLRRYSELMKIRNTYIAAIIDKSVDGWIHPSFNVIGAKSGRISCKDPNYQNIPAHSDEAKKVKRITKAPEGWVLIGADLSAAEMRWVTIASGDEKMAGVFNSGKDSHGAIAKDIFNLECDANEVKNLFKMERQCAKACQFLSIYGGQASALAATAGITEERAQEILDDYFDTYLGIKQYLADTRDFIIAKGYSQSLLGRRNRHASVPVLAAKAAKLDEKGKSLLDQDERMVMEKEIRVAINATIQSVSSDGMLLSACGLQDEIEERKLQDRIKIVNIIHDALYCLVRIEHVHEMHDLIIKHLTTLPVEMLRFTDGSTVELPIKMEADAEWGPDWAHFSEDFGECVVEDEDEDEEEEDEE